MHEMKFTKSVSFFLPVRIGREEVFVPMRICEPKEKSQKRRALTHRGCSGFDLLTSGYDLFSDVKVSEGMMLIEIEGVIGAIAAVPVSVSVNECQLHCKGVQDHWPASRPLEQVFHRISTFCRATA